MVGLIVGVVIGSLFCVFVGVSAFVAGSSKAVRSALRELGIDKGTATRYREAAKILHDLEQVVDLDDGLTLLPVATQKRVSQWNRDHKEAIRG